MAYDKPFRLRVLEAITESLKQITPANGYKHDLSENVFRGRLWYGEDDPLPLVSIVDDPLPVTQMMSGAGAQGDGTESTGAWTLLIQGFIEDDKINPTDPAQYLMADVKKRLAFERQRKTGSTTHGGGRYNAFGMGGDVESLTIGAGVVRPPDYDVSAKAYFWLTLTITVNEDLLDPYA